MSRIAKDKPYRTLINGFITEATGLTFPENCAQDIDNCDIELKGTVRRRLGLNEEANGYTVGQGRLVDTMSGILDGGPYANSLPLNGICPQANLAVTVHIWPHPGGRTDLNFIVWQIGNRLIVRNWDSEPVSSPTGITSIVTGNVEFILDDQTTGVIYNTNATLAMQQELQSSAGFGRLWFTGTHVLPFYLDLDPIALVLTVQPVGYDASNSEYLHGRMSIRDFNGVPDGLSTTQWPTTLTDEHRYNLWNQGWDDDKITAYTALTPVRYPSNAQQWILGKDSTGAFNPGLLTEQDFGTGKAPKGRAIFHALLGDRDSAFVGQQYNNITDGPTDYEPLTFNGKYDEKALASFTSTAFYAGRVWFAGDDNPKRPNGVYFSKTLSQITDSGIYMQEGDPTAEHFSDLLATDGGVIYITEAGNILKLMPYGSGLCVFADNGVWFIYGGTGTGGFTATNYSVEKITATGLLSAKSVVQTDTALFYFAQNSVQTVALPQTGIVPMVQDIALSKIFTYYATIPRVAREQAQACFDTISKKVFWSWLSADDYNYPQFQSCYNTMLILDTRTGAFTKYSFTESEAAPYFFNGPAFPKRAITTPLVLDSVVTSAGQVVTSTGDPVVVFVPSDETIEFLNSVKVTMLDGPATSLRVAEFYDTNFRDYRTMTSYIVQDYASYVITGEEILEDLQRNKQATYIHTFFKRTETGFETDVSGQIVLKNPSGATMVARWDWNITAGGHRWSSPQNVYRYRRPFGVPSVGGDLDTGDSIVYNKSKARGKGRSLSIRFDSVSQKDFQLLGWSVPYTIAEV